MSISKEEFNKAEQEAQAKAAEEAVKENDQVDDTTVTKPSTRSSEDNHQFHSPLNSNAIITISTDEPIDIQPLLKTHETFELLPSVPPFIKIKFIDKNEATNLKDEILLKYPDLEINVEYDALTHPGNIYVRGLLPEITTQDLYKIFEPFGEITSLKIVNDEFGRSKGYGFINFVDGDSADEAITKLNGLLVNGSKLYLNHHIAKKERLERMDFEKSNFTNLYIKNLPIDYTLELFNQLFEKFGEINSTFLPDLPEHELNNPTSKRFGFVNFKNHESAIAAIEELNNKEISPNHLLSVSRAQRRDERNDHHNNNVNSFRNNSISPTPAPLIFQSPPPIISTNPIPTALPPNLITSPQLQHPISATPSQGTTPIIPLPLPGPNHQQSNLYVKNLSPTIDDNALHSAFAPFGIIVSAKVMTTEDGSSRGFGFVCFRTSPEASRALLAMNGNVLDGNILHVSFAQKNSRRKFQSNPPHQQRMEYPYYYNQYQTAEFASMYYGGNGNAPPGGAPPPPQTPGHLATGLPNGNNGYIPYNAVRYSNNGNGFNKYNGFKNYNNGFNRVQQQQKQQSSDERINSEYSKRIGKLTSEISSIGEDNDDVKIEKISKFLIIPKLLENGQIENVELKAKNFLQSQVEDYKQQQQNDGADSSDVYLDIINDWANDENSLIQSLEKLSL